MRRLSREAEKAAFAMYLEGATWRQICRTLRIPMNTLRQYIERGDVACGKRPWRERRADIYRRRENAEDGDIARSIQTRNLLLTDIEKRGLKKLRRRVRRTGKDLTVAELTAVSRETTQALRLAVDAERTVPQTQINVNTSAHAGGLGPGHAMVAALSSESGGTRITLATIEALRSASPEEREALRAWQRKVTLALESSGQPASQKPDELAEVVDVVAEPVRKRRAE